MNLRIAIITANIGGFDPIFGMCKQVRNYDFHYYNENNLPFPLPNLNNRLKSKYIKIQAHRFLPDYDLYIWLDGRIKIIANSFIDHFVANLTGHDFAFYKHRERSTINEELEYILSMISKGNDYLTSRYVNQSLEKELKFYKDNNTQDLQLYMTGVFARWNSFDVNKACDDWWMRSLEYSYFDQAMISHIVKKHDLKINGMEYDDIRTIKLFTIDKHI